MRLWFIDIMTTMTVKTLWDHSTHSRQEWPELQECRRWQHRREEWRANQHTHLPSIDQSAYTSAINQPIRMACLISQSEDCNPVNWTMMSELLDFLDLEVLDFHGGLSSPWLNLHCTAVIRNAQSFKEGWWTIKGRTYLFTFKLKMHFYGGLTQMWKQ